MMHKVNSFLLLPNFVSSHHYPSMLGALPFITISSCLGLFIHSSQLLHCRLSLIADRLQCRLCRLSVVEYEHIYSGNRTPFTQWRVKIQSSVFVQKCLKVSESCLKYQLLIIYHSQKMPPTDSNLDHQICKRTLSRLRQQALAINKII